MIRYPILAIILLAGILTIGCQSKLPANASEPAKTLVPDTSPSAHKMGNPGS